MRQSTLALVLLATLFLSGALAAPSLKRRDHSMCGCDGQCGAGKCYKCGSGGWNCGTSSLAACGQDGIGTAGVCPAPHSLCGCDSQCPGGKCYKCGSGGWNCGTSSLAACGENVDNAGTCPAPHNQCGCDSQCPGGKCYKCSGGGWNCGTSSLAACGENVDSAGTCPPPHNQCGCDDQCAGKGGFCFKCSGGGWNCGANSADACGESVAAAGACPKPTSSSSSAVSVPTQAPVECVDGAKRCTGTGLGIFSSTYQFCDGGKWGPTTSCPLFYGCTGLGECTPTVECTNGQKRCFSTTQTQICVQGRWQDPVNCFVNGYCFGDGQCRSACTELSQICAPSNPAPTSTFYTCVNGNYSSVGACATGKSCYCDTTDPANVNGCLAGTTVCKVCDVNHDRCVGNIQQHCSADETKVETSVDCSATKSNGWSRICGYDQDPLRGKCQDCTPGETRCKGNQIFQCGDTGAMKGMWDPAKTVTCTGLQVCATISGKEKCADCVPGTSQCGSLTDPTSLFQIKTCDGTGKYGTLQNCPLGTQCKTASAGASATCELATGCLDGSTKCTGSNLFVCTLGQWTFSQTCADPTSVCAVVGTGPTASKCAECMPKETRCVGTQVQKCSDSGKWPTSNCPGSPDCGTLITECNFPFSPTPNCRLGVCSAN